jgi:hypothetical protein
MMQTTVVKKKIVKTAATMATTESSMEKIMQPVVILRAPRRTPIEGVVRHPHTRNPEAVRQ